MYLVAFVSYVSFSTYPCIFCVQTRAVCMCANVFIQIYIGIYILYTCCVLKRRNALHFAVPSARLLWSTATFGMLKIFSPAN